LRLILDLPMNMKLAFAVVAACLFPSVAMSQDNWRTLREEVPGFSMRIPLDWTVERHPGEFGFMLQAPDETPEKPGIAGCTAMIRPAPETRGTTQAALDAELRRSLSRTDVVPGSFSYMDDVRVRESWVGRQADASRSLRVVVSGTTRLGKKPRLWSVVDNTAFTRPGWTYGVICSVATRTPELTDRAYTNWRPTFERLAASARATAR
jgi:hypothetical protein